MPTKKNEACASNDMTSYQFWKESIFFVKSLDWFESAFTAGVKETRFSYYIDVFPNIIRIYWHLQTSAKQTVFKEITTHAKE